MSKLSRALHKLGCCFLLAATSVSMPLSVLAEDWVYTVRPGDSLWKISHDYLLSPEYWSKVQKLNGVEDVLELPPGKRLSIPVEWLKQQPFNATIVAYHGQVELVREKQVLPLALASLLQMGDGIRTGKSSSVNIAFADGSELLVLSESEILLEIAHPLEHPSEARTTVKIIKGRVENKVKQRNGARRYEVYTPAAVAAVRGTEFRVAADNNGEVMRSEVLTGSVTVSGSGASHTVEAGFATIAKLGVPPTPPIAIPSAPDLKGLQKRFAQTTVNFRWQEVNGLTRYRALLAKDEALSQVIGESLLEVSQVEWRPLEPAMYYMRVNAIDTSGIEGFGAVHQFTVIEPLPKPTATTPGDGAEFVDRQPFIAWSNTLNASLYRLQIAVDAGFTKDVVEYQGIVNSNFSPPSLKPGEYYWRVQSISKNNDRSEFSDPRSFVLHSTEE